MHAQHTHAPPLLFLVCPRRRLQLTHAHPINVLFAYLLLCSHTTYPASRFFLQSPAFGSHPVQGTPISPCLIASPSIITRNSRSAPPLSLSYCHTWLDLLDLRALFGFERRHFIYTIISRGVVKNHLGCNNSNWSWCQENRRHNDRISPSIFGATSWSFSAMDVLIEV